VYSHDHEHLLARRSPDWYTRWPSSSSSTEGGRGLYLGRRIDIGACQELDPIAGRGPAVFGIPCSRQSDSVTGRAGRRCHISRVEAPLGRSMGRQVTSAVSTWPSDARQVERSPIINRSPYTVPSTIVATTTASRRRPV